MQVVAVLPETQRFVLTTFSFFECPLHEMAAAFVYGREGITSPMFENILKWIKPEQEKQYSTLIYYLKRHVALDSGEHFPKALKMLSNLIGDDPKKFEETEKAAQKALRARIDFLTAVHDHVIKVAGE